MGIDFILPTGATVSGTIADAAGNPIASEVFVVLLNSDGLAIDFAAVSSDAGYSIVNLPEGSFRIAAYSKNYLFDSVALSIVEGESRTVDLNAGPGHISGTVTDPAGNPVAEATVILSAVDPLTSEVHGTATTTAADGSYVLFGCPDGQITLTIQKEGFAQTSGSTPSEFGVDLRANLVFAEGYRITGTVIDQAVGVPVADARVFAIELSSQDSKQLVTECDEMGNWAFSSLAEGQCRFVVLADNYATHVEDVVIEGTVTIDVAMDQEGATLRGTVLDSATNLPVGRAVIIVYLEGVLITYVATDEWSGQDDAGGSGVASYTIYVSDNGGPLQPWLTNTTLTQATFDPALDGHTYAFYSIATDAVGHVEAAPETADAQTLAIEPETVEVVEVTVTNWPTGRIAVQFDEPMAVQGMIDDGSTVPTVALVSFTGGAYGLTRDSFAYDESTQTLEITLPALLPAGYFELRLAGNRLFSVAGHVLRGGQSGLSFAVVTFGAEQEVMANGTAAQPILTTDGPIDLPCASRSRPFLGDFNADGVPDILLGAGDGLVRWYAGQTQAHSAGESPGRAGAAYSFTFELQPFAAPPSDIDLAGTSIAENLPAGTLVGLLATTDPDPGDAFTYSLVAGPGGEGNAMFTIPDGTNEVRTAAAFDFETLASYSIRVQTMDLAGNTFAESFTITVLDVDEIPPTVTINQAAGQADPTNTGPIHFTAVSSEPVAGFVAGDVVVGGTAAGTLSAVVTPVNATTYDVAVSGMTGSGTVTASVRAGAAQDAAGNLSGASTSTDNSVTYSAAPAFSAKFDFGTTRSLVEPGYTRVSSKPRYTPVQKFGWLSGKVGAADTKIGTAAKQGSAAWP